jgi:hypothetical protein
MYPTFSNAWFTEQTQPLWQKHFADAGLAFPRCLEIGVFEGASMLWACENLGVDYAVGIDPWEANQKRRAERYAEFRQRAYANLKPFRDRITFIQESSHSALPKILCGIHDVQLPFDMIYLDGSHTA